MPQKNIPAFLATTLVFLFFAYSSARAQSAEEPFHIPGTVEGSGKHFAINDSEYLNITLESSENISVRIESAPEMIVLDIKGSADVTNTNLILSGFPANSTFHRYQDDYHNYSPLAVDENGTASFELDISRDHVIFIQPRKSTKSIYGSYTGGDCNSIGSWNASAKTCTLNQDVNETIELYYTDGITLDGNGHTVSGNSTGSGIYATGKNITIKNITVIGFYYGVYLSSSVKYGKIDSVTAKDNRNGIYLNNSHYNSISNNTIISSISYGLGLITSENNTVSDNTIGPGNAYGISQEYSCNYNTFNHNNISSNKNTGVRTNSGSYLTFRDNTISSNAYDGIVMSGGDHHALSGNIMSGNGFGGFNGKSNFSISGSNMSTNNIDQSNMVEGKPIYYLKGESNKIYDNSFNIGSFYCINCNGITIKNLPLSDHSAEIFFWHTNNSSVEGVASPDKSSRVDLYFSSNNIIKNNNIGKIQVQYSSNNNQIYNNNFSDTYSPVYLYSSTGNLFNLDYPIGGNHWKKYETSCQDLNNDNFCDLPFTFSINGADNLPLTKEIDFNKPACCSSVMFLPGHQASRLYRKDGSNEDRLWEPTNRNEDVEQMYLDADGESVNPEIYTRDIIDETYAGVNIYKSFMSFMDKMVSDGIINKWQYIPYDWRLPLETIVKDGVNLENGETGDILQEIRSLAASSKTGKVTLIGHSNGGLLGKTIINKLKETGEEKLVDRLVMVATPQLGTPKAIAGLLHGDEINLLHGLLLDKKTARGFAENMASAYNLLPSKKYFDTVQSPVVEFDSDVKDIYDFSSIYGDNIGDWNEFKKFLLGDDGARVDPAFGDTDSPNVLSANLLARSEDTHNKLDNWQAPEGMEVIQIAGWGLDTIRGIKYDDCDFIFCPDRLSNLDRSLVLTEDGDETVVVPSAVEIGGAERYYVNIKEHNKELILNARRNRSHSSILEIDSLRDFISNIIKNNKNLTDHISVEKPAVKDGDKRLRFRLHSPVSLNIYDQGGYHTGLVNDPDSGLQLTEEQIPNSYYLEFGETKYAGAGDSPIDVELIGEDLGTFTLEIDQVASDQVAKKHHFCQRSSDE